MWKQTSHCVQQRSTERIKERLTRFCWRFSEC